MPGNTGYPGVDPDGRLPGGLEIAGNVEAGSFSNLGAPIVPSAVAAGSWSCVANQSVLADGSSYPLKLDTENTPLDGVLLNLTTGKLDVTISGLYLLLGDAYSNTGWVAGYIGSISRANIASLFSSMGAIGPDGSGNAAAHSFALGYVNAGDTLYTAILNATGGTANFSGDLAVVRLA